MIVETNPTVGIMSMHRILNYGSTLQAHCLRQLIETGTRSSTVRFIDFRPGDALFGEASAGTKVGRAINKICEYGREEGSVADKIRFMNHKRAYAGRYLPGIGVPREPNYDTTVDIEVIGSDEVFNCSQSNTRVGHSPDLFGRGSSAGRVISYAASFGNTTLEQIHSAGIAGRLAEDFERFTHISVRDVNSQFIIAELSGRSAEIHVDPVLAFDIMTDEPRIPGHRLNERPYMVVYAYPGRLTHSENVALRELADSRGMQILTFGGFQACGDRFIDCDPFTLLAYFRDAEAVITDTFHGTIFSMVTERPFLTFIRASQATGYGNEEKLGFLLSSFGLESRRAKGVRNLQGQLNEEIDWVGVRSRLEQERKRSSDYLKQMIGDRDD